GGRNLLGRPESEEAGSISLPATHPVIPAGFYLCHAPFEKRPRTAIADHPSSSVVVISPWQIGAAHVARIIGVLRQLAGAVCCEFADPSEEPFATTVFSDQHSKPVLARPPALGALDPHRPELADQVAECDRVVGVVHSRDLTAAVTLLV